MVLYADARGSVIHNVKSNTEFVIEFTSTALEEEKKPTNVPRRSVLVVAFAVAVRCGRALFPRSQSRSFLLGFVSCITCSEYHISESLNRET